MNNVCQIEQDAQRATAILLEGFEGDIEERIRKAYLLGRMDQAADNLKETARQAAGPRTLTDDLSGSIVLARIGKAGAAI